jgi:hypothetical protein
MDRDQISRRNFMYTAAQWVALGGAAGTMASCGDNEAASVDGAASTASACVSPDDLSSAELSLRQSVSYTDMAADSEAACGRCAYFHADGETGCGRCDILQGVVSATGHCVSWAQQASRIRVPRLMHGSIA